MAAKENFLMQNLQSILSKAKVILSAYGYYRISNERYMIFGKRSIVDIKMMIMGTSYLHGHTSESKMRTLLH